MQDEHTHQLYPLGFRWSKDDQAWRMQEGPHVFLIDYNVDGHECRLRMKGGDLALELKGTQAQCLSIHYIMAGEIHAGVLA